MAVRHQFDGRGAHVAQLEHLGALPQTYLGIIQELYRICRPNARVTIIVPHPRHDDFLADPTHVRGITMLGLRLFSKRLNRGWIERGAANTPFGLQLDVDFEIESTTWTLDSRWQERLDRGELTLADIQASESKYNNVVKQFTFVLRAVKEEP